MKKNTGKAAVMYSKGHLLFAITETWSKSRNLQKNIKFQMEIFSPTTKMEDYITNEILQ